MKEQLEVVLLSVKPNESPDHFHVALEIGERRIEFTAVVEEVPLMEGSPPLTVTKQTPDLIEALQAIEPELAGAFLQNPVYPAVFRQVSNIYHGKSVSLPRVLGSLHL